jgi:hypothetical protein
MARKRESNAGLTQIAQLWCRFVYTPRVRDVQKKYLDELSGVGV